MLVSFSVTDGLQAELMNTVHDTLGDDEARERDDKNDRRPSPFAGIQSFVNEAREKERIHQQENAETEKKRVDALNELAREVVADHFNNQRNADFSKFFRAMNASLGNKFVRPELREGYRGSDLLFAIFKDMEMEKNLLRYRDNHAAFTIKTNTITFNPSTSQFGIDDAFEMALFAAHNRNMLGKQVKLTGTDREKAFLQYALEQVNNALAPEQKISIKGRKPLPKEMDFGNFTLDSYLQKMGAVPGASISDAFEAQAEPEQQQTAQAGPKPRHQPTERPLRQKSPPPPTQDDIADKAAFTRRADGESVEEMFRGRSAKFAHTPQSNLSERPEGGKFGSDSRTVDDSAPIEPDDIFQEGNIFIPEAEPRRERPHGAWHDDAITVPYKVVDFEARAAKAKREYDAIEKALIEHISTTNEFPGRAIGDVIMKYPKNTWRGKITGKDRCDVFTTEVDIYEDGTPPATVEYVCHKKLGKLHLVTITKSQGYEGYANPNFENAVNRWPQKEWGNPEDPEILKAANHFYAHAEFADELKVLPAPDDSGDELVTPDAPADKPPSAPPFETPDEPPLEDPSQESAREQAQAQVQKQANADEPAQAPNDAPQPPADRKSRLALLAGWIRHLGRNKAEPGGDAPAEPESPALYDVKTSGMTLEPEKAEQPSAAASKRQPPHIAQIIVSRVNAIFKRPGTYSAILVASGAMMVAATIDPSESTAVTSPTSSAMTARVDLSPETARSIDLASLFTQIITSRRGGTAPMTPPVGVTPPFASQSSENNFVVAVVGEPGWHKADLLLKSERVNVDNLDSRLDTLLPTLDLAWQQCAPGKTPIVTSAQDQFGEHVAGSQHRHGGAADVRTINGEEHPLTLGEAQDCYNELISRLPNLTILWERGARDHIHIQIPRAGEEAVHRIVLPRQHRRTPAPAIVAASPAATQIVTIIPESVAAVGQPVIIASDQEAHPAHTF